MSIHVRVLANLKQVNDILPQVPEASIAVFREHIRTPEQLVSQLNNVQELISAAQISIPTSIQKSSGGRGISQLHFVSETLAGTFRSDCARLGIFLWSPNTLESHDSLYNDAHRLVFLRTLKIAVVSREYDWIPALNPKLLADSYLMLKLYNHTVHHLWASKTLVERTIPGSLQMKREIEAAGKRRSRVSSMCKLIWITLMPLIADGIAHSIPQRQQLPSSLSGSGWQQESDLGR